MLDGNLYLAANFYCFTFMLLLSFVDNVYNCFSSNYAIVSLSRNRR